MTLSYRNGVSIAEIIVYVPCLVAAVLLTIRHGFSRSAGWYFLVVFSLARIIGPCMQLATISNPTSISLYTGYSILQNVGLSPLQLATVGLLSRLLASINKTHHTLVNNKSIHIVHLIILIGLVLGIVGGVDASNNISSTGVYTPGTLSKAAAILFIVSYLLIVLVTILTAFSVSHAEAGEKRLLLAVALALPFLLVRVIYSILSTFSHSQTFNLLDGNVTVLLCVALVEELIIVLIYETIGMTLNKVVKERHVEGYYAASAQPVQIPSNSSAGYATQQNYSAAQRQPQENVALRIAKKTIIGRLVMRASDSRSQDAEMRYVTK